jgi:predicted DNA-binding transcriptional regulator YafY
LKHLTHYDSLNESFSLTEELSFVALFENYAMNLEKLEDSISNKFVCKIDYKGEIGTKILPGSRLIEPYALGVDSNGNTLLRAWLISGISRSGRIDPKLVPGWRLFRLDRIRSINPTLQKFLVARKGYNPDDKNMTEVTFSATF